MAQDALPEALSAFRRQQRIEDIHDLRDRFYACASQPQAEGGHDLVEMAIDYVHEQGINAPGHQVACLLLGTGEHHFHHGEPNLAHIFQGDMPTLAEMVDQEARATHAAHATHDPATIPPLPAYLRHERQHFTIEASERRDGEWRHYHFTTLRTHLVGRLEEELAGAVAEQLPMASHRVELGDDRVERQRVPYSLADKHVHRDLTLFSKRLAHRLADHALGILQGEDGIPGAIGIDREPDSGPGHPEPLWTIALAEPSDAARLNCGDIEGCMNWLGTFDMAPWMDDIVEWGSEQIDREVRREITRLREQYAGLQGPPEPYRMVASASLDRLLENIREEVSKGGC